MNVKNRFQNKSLQALQILSSNLNGPKKQQQQERKEQSPLILKKHKKKELKLHNQDDLEVIIEIFHKKLGKSTAEIRILQKIFEKVQFFNQVIQELSKEEYDNLFMHLEYEQCQANQVLFTIGEYGAYFYIILSGSVDVYIPKENIQQSNNQSMEDLNNQNQINLFDDKNQDQNGNIFQQNATVKYKNQVIEFISDKEIIVSKKYNKNEQQEETNQDVFQFLPVNNVSDDQSASITKHKRGSSLQLRKNFHDLQKIAIKIPVNENKEKSRSVQKTTTKQQDKKQKTEVAQSISEGENFALECKSPEIRRQTFRKSVLLDPTSLRDFTYFPNNIGTENATEMIETIQEQDEEPDYMFQNIDANEEKQINKRDKAEYFLKNTAFEQQETKQLKKEKFKSVKVYQKVRTMGTGESFGEIALMNSGKRTATLICANNVHLVKLSKWNYDKILAHFHKQSLNDRINFFKEMYIFNQWPATKILSLLKNIEVQSFQKKQIVYREGDLVNAIYFVKEGFVEVSKIVDLYTQEMKRLDLQDTFPEVTKLNQVWTNQNQRRTNKRVVLEVIGPQNFFGGEELIQNINRNTKAVIKSLSAEIYVLPVHKYQQNLYKLNFNKELKKMMNEKHNYTQKYIGKSRMHVKNVHPQVNVKMLKGGQIQLHVEPYSSIAEQQKKLSPNERCGSPLRALQLSSDMISPIASANVSMQQKQNNNIDNDAKNNKMQIEQKACRMVEFERSVAFLPKYNEKNKRFQSNRKNLFQLKSEDYNFLKQSEIDMSIRRSIIDSTTFRAELNHQRFMNHKHISNDMNKPVPSTSERVIKILHIDKIIFDENINTKRDNEHENLNLNVNVTSNKRSSSVSVRPSFEISQQTHQSSQNIKARTTNSINKQQTRSVSHMHMPTLQPFRGVLDEQITRSTFANSHFRISAPQNFSRAIFCRQSNNNNNISAIQNNNEIADFTAPVNFHMTSMKIIKQNSIIGDYSRNMYLHNLRIKLEQKNKQDHQNYSQTNNNSEKNHIANHKQQNYGLMEGQTFFQINKQSQKAIIK